MSSRTRLQRGILRRPKTAYAVNGCTTPARAYHRLRLSFVMLGTYSRAGSVPLFHSGRLLLCVHHGKPTKSHLCRRDQQSRATRLPTQDACLRRIHSPIQCESARVFRTLCYHPRSHRARKGNQGLATGKEVNTDKFSESEVERLELWLVSATCICPLKFMSSRSALREGSDDNWKNTRMWTGVPAPSTA
jgi:hypothetical protein